MKVRYRYRVYPDGSQRQMLARTFGCARVVYNNAIRYRDESYQAGQKISDTDVQKHAVTLARAENDWMAEVSSVALASIHRSNSGDYGRVNVKGAL